MRLHNYFRSSASYRVRIALNLKGLAYTSVPVHLLRDGGQQHADSFSSLNPARLVPVLEDGAATITQSLAIIEYLEEQYPSPALLRSVSATKRRELSGRVVLVQYLEHLLAVPLPPAPRMPADQGAG